jgi:hypothetical protein
MESAPLVGSSAGVRLIGFADPCGVFTGFLIPVFRHSRRNSRLIQVLDRTGAIESFEPCDLPDVETYPVDPVDAPIGDLAFWGFGFQGRLIWGNKEEARLPLNDLLEAGLQHFPFLAMEVAEFLGLSLHRDRFAKHAYDKIAKTSALAAKSWRDLCVLTPDVRNSLLTRFGFEAHWPTKAVLTVESNSVIAVHGLPHRLSLETEAVLRKATVDAIRSLPRLYDGLHQVHLAFSPTVEESSNKYSVRLIVDRTIDIDQLAWRIRRVSQEDIHFVDWDSHSTPAPSDVPTIVLVRDCNRGLLFALFERFNSDELFVIVYSDKVTQEQSPSLYDILDGRLLHVFGRWSAAENSPSGIISILLAIRLAVAVKGGLFNIDQDRNCLFWTYGDKTDGDPTGLIGLYKSAYIYGLCPWKSVSIRHSGRRLPPAGEREHALFGEQRVKVIDGNLADESHAHPIQLVLVDPVGRSSADEKIHCSRVRRFFSALVWRVEGDANASSFTICGSRGTFEVMLDSVLTKEELAKRAPSAPRFHRIRTIRLVAVATSRSLVQHLAYSGELVCTMTDLLNFDDRSATVWPILNAWIRRLRGLRTERFRSHLIFWIVREALSARPEGSLEQRIAKLMKGRKPHVDLQFSIERAVSRDAGLRALVNVVKTVEGRVQTKDPSIRFVLQISKDGPNVDVVRG